LGQRNNNPGDLILPAVYEGDYEYEEKHESAYGEKHERRWKLAACPVSAIGPSRCFNLFI